MSDIIKLVLAAVVFTAIGYSLGRYAGGGSTKTTTETKTDETVKTDEHQRETITQKKSTDGTVTTVTVIDTVKDQLINKDSDTQSQTVTTKPEPKINLSALVSASIHDPAIPAYGISVSKEFIGPITIGAFGLTSGIVGLSIGINF
jgi:hypothetical protein